MIAPYKPRSPCMAEWLLCMWEKLNLSAGECIVTSFYKNKRKSSKFLSRHITTCKTMFYLYKDEDV